jgi:hypothetical protein
MITAYGTVGNVVDAIRAGAKTSSRSPGTTKSCSPTFAPPSPATSAEEEVVQLKRTLKQRYNFENIVGKSEPCCASSTSSRRSRPAAPPC